MCHMVPIVLAGLRVYIWEYFRNWNDLFFKLPSFYYLISSFSSKFTNEIALNLICIRFRYNIQSARTYLYIIHVEKGKSTALFIDIDWVKFH